MGSLCYNLCSPNNVVYDIWPAKEEERGVVEGCSISGQFCIIYSVAHNLQLTLHWSPALMLLPDYCYWVKLQFLTRPTNLQQALWCIFYGDIKIQATLRFISLQSLCCPLRSQKMIFYPKTINSASNNAETFSSISA